jgi:uncharacterized protein YutE (UPF0331/DUF86 family)
VNQNTQTLFQQALTDLAQARKHLDFSFQQVRSMPKDFSAATEAQLESAEAFTSRFARCIDLLVNKVFRALDRVELQSEGTLLDVVSRAEKRGLVTSATELREMKDVRNIIAHDYAGKSLAEIFAYCHDKKPVFDGVCERLITYAAKLPPQRTKQ